MSVAYVSADVAPVPLAHYVCGCGRSAARYGGGVVELPPGWVVLREVEIRCPDCADDPERPGAPAE